MADEARESNRVPPPRGIVRAPRPDGLLDGRRIVPSAALAAHVHHFWSVRWVLRSPFTGEALPHPAAQVVHVDAAGEPRAELVGVQTGRFARRLVGEGRMFGISFRPVMFHPLLGASMATLTDRVLPLEQLLGSQATAWARAIEGAPDAHDRVAITEAFLTPLLPPLSRVRRSGPLREGLQARRRANAAVVPALDEPDGRRFGWGGAGIACLTRGAPCAIRPAMDVIAERTLEFIASGTTQPIAVRILIGRPVRLVFDDVDPSEPSGPRPLAPGEEQPDDSCCWGAPVAIHSSVGAVTEKHILGEDSLQALMLALRILPSFVEASFLSQGTLTCEGAPWDLGLSVSLRS